MKRESPGPCNLCREQRPLSWDHVPPRSSLGPEPVEMATIMQVLCGSPGRRVVSTSQNGVKYRTLCRDCNTRIGRDYDPALAQFVASIHARVKSSLCVPRTVAVSARPFELQRAVLAHVLAAKAELDGVVFDATVRDLLAKSSVSVPPAIKIFYWLYPFARTVVLRDFVIPTRGGARTQMAFCQLIKFYPIAFLVTDGPATLPFRELTAFRAAVAGDVADIPVDLAPVQPEDWPETPRPGHYIFTSRAEQSSVVASPKRPTEGQLTKRCTRRPALRPAGDR
jgi:hypothetical protein